MTLLELHDFVRPLATAEFYRIFAAKGFDAADVARCPQQRIVQKKVGQAPLVQAK